MMKLENMMNKNKFPLFLPVVDFSCSSFSWMMKQENDFVAVF